MDSPGYSAVEGEGGDAAVAAAEPSSTPSASDASVASSAAKKKSCCGDFDWREPMNPQTNVARLGWDALLAVTVIYTVIYTVYALIFLGPEHIVYDTT